MTKLPDPDQWLLTRLSEAECAELIEQHVNYVDEDGRSVHLPMPFVKHYLKRDDNALPIVSAVSTLPIVLADGVLLAKQGLDRDRGIAFHLSEELLAVVPRREECTPRAVGEAMRYLRDDWLCDVAADFTGKYILIAVALTLIERSLLPDRPAFFVTAGRRGGGKTTTLTMLVVAVTGLRPAAAAWSTNEEERRKSLLSYLLEGVPYILWDNIERGSQISCPHIERSCTSAYYSDRRLGVSEAVATAASAIQLFTGNNIGPAISRLAACTSDLPSIGPTRKIVSSSIPILLTGRKSTERKSCARCIRFCSAIRSLPSRAMRRRRRASRCGGG
jgi:hypothetical protein